MQVKVTCPRCGKDFAEAPGRVLRGVKCPKCAHGFVPASEGVPCPSCGSVLILPPGSSKREVVCLKCSFAFRRRRWWQKRKYQVAIALMAVIVFLGICMVLRARSNLALARELRADFKRWLATLPQVPDSENGMFVILQGVKAFEDLLPDELRSEDFDIGVAANREVLQAFLETEDKKSALRKIREGLDYEKFLFPTYYSRGYEAELPNLLSFRNTANVLVRKGELAQYDGREDEALEEYLNALRLGRTLANNHTIVSRMIEVAVLNIGLKPLVRTLSQGQPPPVELEHVLKDLIELHTRGGDFYEAMECEYQCGFAYVVADVIEGKSAGELGVRPNILWAVRLSKYIYNYRSDIEKYHKVLDIYRKVDTTKYYALPQEIKDEGAFMEAVGITPDGSSLANVLIPNLSGCGLTLVETEVLWRGAIALAGIRLFEAKNGRLPKDLSELGGLVPKDLLMDPFSGKDLIYRVAGDDFYLYSMGYDGVDGQGTGDSAIYEKDQYPQEVSDIIFHAPAPAKDK